MGSLGGLCLKRLWRRCMDKIMNETTEQPFSLVPQTQGLLVHLHAIRQARHDVSRFLEFRFHCRIDIRFRLHKP